MRAISPKKTLATALILASLLSGGGLTAANAVEPTSTTTVATGTRLTEISDEQIIRYDQHVTTSGLMGDFVIKSDSKLSPADKAILQQILTKSNQERREALSNVAPHAQTTGNAIQSAGGGITFHWWGHTLWLNNINSYRLSALLAGGTAVATVAAFITSITGVGGIVAGGIAAALTVATAASLICNWNQRGINIHRSNVGATWCTPR